MRLIVSAWLREVTLLEAWAAVNVVEVGAPVLVVRLGKLWAAVSRLPANDTVKPQWTSLGMSTQHTTYILRNLLSLCYYNY